MPGAVHHVAICTGDLDRSLRFWRDGLGLAVVMDERFEGDWPTLLRAPSTALRSVFLADPSGTAVDAGLVELVDLGDVPAGGADPAGTATAGFLLVSLLVDLPATLARLAELDLGGVPRTIEASGVAMAVVHDPDGVAVELIDDAASRALDRLTGPSPG